MVLYEYLKCAANITIDGDHTASTDCTINYRVILLMTSFINSSDKPLKTDPSREICTCATWLMSSSAKETPW